MFGNQLIRGTHERDTISAQRTEGFATNQGKVGMKSGGVRYVLRTIAIKAMVFFLEPPIDHEIQLVR
jgi:hypothetical protein